MTGQLLQWIFWIPVAILAVVLVLFLIANPTDMDAGMTATYGATGTAYVQQAIDTGLADAGGGNTYWGVVMGSILATYWAFIGYGSTNFIAGEVKESGRNLPRAMIISTATISVVYLVVSWLLSRAGAAGGLVQGYDLVGATAWMTFGGGSFGELSGIGPWMPVFAHIQGAGMGMGTIVGWLTLIFAVLWAANDIPPFILSCSRMLFAMAFDRVLPESIADVNEKWHSPVKAIVATSAVAVLGAASEAGLFTEGGIYLGDTWLQFFNGFGLAGSNLWDAIFYASFALAAFVFPMVKPELFEKAPFKASKGVVQLVAGLGLLSNLFFLYIFIVNPRAYDLPGLLAEFTFAKFAVWLATIIIALVAVYFYFSQKSKAKKTGVDYSTIFTEIPPE
jgi:amino acid transporter